MKKKKTYEISVIDKTYSKTISDETKFYTSDTALELVFKLKETEYTFESAEIVLLNIDDRSLTTRPVSKVNNDFVYELDDDITPHYGEWLGQLRFEQAGEFYGSSPVKFRIENDLGNERPPQLSDVQSWVSLKRYADSLIEELRQAVLSAETFKINEATRKANEEARELAEDERENAEAQRKIEHANRSSELDGKADKVFLKNTVTNGDFSDGLVGWNKVGFPSNMSVVDNELRIIGAPSSTSGIMQDIKGSTSDKFYIRIHKYENLNGVFVRVFDYGTYSNGEHLFFGVTDSHIVSKREGIRIYFQVPPTESIDINATIDKVSIMNLTRTFGAGNEPTKEEMNELIKVTGYIDGEYALNNKEMLIWTLALIRRNRNTIITLGGTI